MEIRNLTRESIIYTSNAWMCTCTGSGPGCRTLIDTGCDPDILRTLREISQATGGRPLDRIILTHNHYDHTKMAVVIKKEFNPEVYAWSSYTPGVDQVVKDGTVLPMGDAHLEIISIPGHTSDSICIYCPEEEALFSGDTPVVIWGTENSYEKGFVFGFENLAKRRINTIYPGHGEIIGHGISVMLRQSLDNLKKSRLI